LDPETTSWRGWACAGSDRGADRTIGGEHASADSYTHGDADPIEHTDAGADFDADAPSGAANADAATNGVLGPGQAWVLSRRG
jgi:hypothetical protein